MLGTDDVKMNSDLLRSDWREAKHQAGSSGVRREVKKLPYLPYPTVRYCTGETEPEKDIRATCIAINAKFALLAVGTEMFVFIGRKNFFIFHFGFFF